MHSPKRGSGVADGTAIGYNCKLSSGPVAPCVAQIHPLRDIIRRTTASLIKSQAYESNNCRSAAD